jgi:ribose transport system substrate-binding protein
MRRSLWVVMGALVGACGGQPMTTTPKNLTFAFIPKSKTSKPFAVGIDGAKAKGLELTQGETTVTVNVSGPETSTNATDLQAQAVNDAIDAKVNGIIMSVTSTSVIGPLIDKAVDAGIPVITFDSDAPTSQRLSYFSQDDRKVGAHGAELAFKLPAVMNATSHEYAIVSGAVGALNEMNRGQGYVDTMTTHGWTNKSPLSTGSTVAMYDGVDEVVANLAARVEKAVTDNPNLSVLFVTGTWPFRCIAAGNPAGCLGAGIDAMPNWKAKATSGQLTTIVIGGLSEEENAMKANAIQVIMAVKFWNWGYDTVQMMYDHIATGKALPVSVDPGASAVCPNNVEQALQAWSSNNFSTPLTMCSLEQ